VGRLARPQKPNPWATIRRQGRYTAVWCVGSLARRPLQQLYSLCGLTTALRWRLLCPCAWFRGGPCSTVWESGCICCGGGVYRYREANSALNSPQQVGLPGCECWAWPLSQHLSVCVLRECLR
jgi:hypothetical protein